MTQNALVEFFLQGGLIFMLPLLALSILSLAVIIERLFFLCRQNAALSRFIGQCEKATDRNALITCWSGTKQECMAGRILNDAERIVRTYGTVSSFESAVERAAGAYVPFLARYLWILRAIGQTAPFLGLTGTVVGLAVSFRNIADAGLSQQSVAGGISIALNTTIMGLVIALPTLLAEHALRAWAQSLLQRMEVFLGEVVLRSEGRR